ncbi:insulinase family protein [candidate division KSB1 bacterium]|nr:MAG: insulinase family protein [candidate division KSB1 bacterium]
MALSQYHKTKLPDGLRIVTENIPGVHSAALGIWIEVGSRHESESENGISHFIEHMAFKGTKTRTAFDIARSIERGGGYVNAFTSKELTCFHVHVLDEQLDEALDILSDILLNSMYDPQEMEKEKQVILDEIRDHEDMPDDVAHERFVRALFEPHPLARPILGPPANVRAFTRNGLLKFVKRNYVPARILVAAAGHVNHAHLVRRVRSILEFGRDNHFPAEKRMGRLTSRLDRHHRAIQQAHMVLGTRALSYGDRERFTLSVMNTILGGGMSSRLFQNIREKHGVAYSVYSFAEMFGDTGLWGVYLATDPDRVDRAREMVLNELRIIRETPLTKHELEGVKTQLKGSVMLSLESVSNRMMRLGRMELYLGRYHSLEDVSRQIDAVTTRKVQDLANELLTEKKLVTTIVEPEAEPKKKTTRKRGK